MENNKIIAEFIQPSFNGFGLYDFDGGHYKLDELKFHSDWNWLMEVVEKIENLDFIIRITLTQCSILNQSLIYKHTETQGTKIQAVYNACVEFIKWYNESREQ